MDKYGIYQVTIPLPFRLNHVHSYLARQGNQWTIIDTGLNRKETEIVWQEAFEKYRINPREDISKIILTHYHPDHLGYAGMLEEWTQAPVYMGDQGQFWAHFVWKESTSDQTDPFFRANGMPDELVDQITAYDRQFRSLVWPLPKRFEAMKAGQRIQIGELTYEAIETAGHAEGHFCFYSEEAKVLIGGDHILRKITPNISYYGYGAENPLQQYMESLKKFQSLDISLVIPGHGPLFSDVGERIEEILTHHEERIEKVLDHLRGERTAYQVCKDLFNRELTLHEQRFAIGETLAHLNYLVEKGEVKKMENMSGKIYFSK